MEIPFTSKPRPDTGIYNSKVGIWLFLASEVMLFGALFSAYILLRVGAPEGTWVHGLLNIPIGTFNTAVLITSSVTVVLGWASLQVGNFGRYKFYLCALAFLGIKSYEYREKFLHHEVWLNHKIKVKHGHQEVETDRIIGHLEYNGHHQYFWNTKHLKELVKGTPEVKDKDGKVITAEVPPLESFTMIPDAFHYTMSPKELAHARKESAGAAHEEIEIKASDVKRLSAFVPSHSTYFAIYFTLTGLHGLHVLGGAIVIFYIWGPGAKMWKTDPQRYMNRVEVSGLFWHFVDLVWIFLFPVIYLL
jgi:cytochrome c oxidase subunit 3